MAVRPPRGLLAALALAVVVVTGCGQDEHSDSAATQRQRLVRDAEAALQRYNARAVVPGAYRGRGVRLRVTSTRRVAFSIWLTCSGRRLRAFPDHRPRIRPDGRFAYRERGRRYRLRVSGRVRPTAARGQVALAARPAQGRGCRIRTSWRAASA